MLTKKTRLSRPSRDVRKQPVQGRSRETVAVILEAAARVLEKDGFAGYNTNAVAERAGVSIGSVYQYFPNKDVLTLALIAKFEQELVDALQITVATARGKELQQSLRLVVRKLLEVHQGRAALNRLLELEEDRLRPNTGDRRASDELRAMVETLLYAHRAQLSVKVNADAVHDVLTIARALVDAALLGATPLRSAERRIMQALLGYLLWQE